MVRRRKRNRSNDKDAAVKILFFTQNRWAFGSIHHGLCKELWKYGHYANLLDWDIGYGRNEMKAIADTYDVFITQPDGVESLESYGIPLDRIVAVGHGEWDIHYAKQNAKKDFYPLLRGFGVISNVLEQKCAEIGLSRVPEVVQLGLHTCLYDFAIPDRLESVGYAGALASNNWHGTEIKRGWLVEKACQKAGLPLEKKEIWNNLAMPGYYNQVDAVVMSSIEEAGGLPMMECAAAGRLPIGTPVGYFAENAINGAGVLVPMDAEEFVEVTASTLFAYKNNPAMYRAKCAEAREYAIQNYDWGVRIAEWINLICK